MDASSDLLRARDSQLGHLRAQRFLGAVHFLGDVRLRGSENARPFRLRVRLRVLNHLRGLATRLVDDPARLRAGLVQGFLHACLGMLQVALGLGRVLEPRGQSFLALAHGADQERPDELPAERHEDEEGDRLGRSR